MAVTGTQTRTLEPSVQGEARTCEQQACLGSASPGFEPRVAYGPRVLLMKRAAAAACWPQVTTASTAFLGGATSDHGAVLQDVKVDNSVRVSRSEA